MRLARLQGEPFNELEMPLGTPKRAVNSKIKGNLWISYGYGIDILWIFLWVFYGYVLCFFLVEEVLIHPIYYIIYTYIYIYGFIVERLISVALVSWRLPPSKFSS